MKITSKQIYTTVILDDGTHCDMVKKTVYIEDTSFDSMDINDIHNTIAIALCNRIQSPSVTQNMAVKMNPGDSEVGR